jgi:hypothetical protein
MEAINPILELAIAFRQLPDNLIITCGRVSVEECSDQLNLPTDTEFVCRHVASPSRGASDKHFSL